MEIKIENIYVLYPNEKQGEERTFLMSDDGVLLNISIDDSSGKPNACITLNKSQVQLLSDCLKIYIDNDLIDEIEN